LETESRTRIRREVGYFESMSGGTSELWFALLRLSL